MGRIVFGIDIDEHPVGGLIEALLADEDIEKLRESPRAAPDGGSSGEESGDDESGDDGDSADNSDAADRSVSDAAGPSGDDDGRGRSTANTTARTVSGTNEWRARALDGETDDADEEQPPLITRVRKGLLFASVGAVGFGIVAALVRRFLGRFEPAEEPEPDDRECSGSTEKPHTSSETAAEPTTAADEGVAGLDSEEEGSPLGALLGLGLLAVAAALVRTFEEQEDAEIPVTDGEG